MSIGRQHVESAINSRPAAEILALRRQFDHARIIWLSSGSCRSITKTCRADRPDVGDEAAVLRQEPKGARRGSVCRPARRSIHARPDPLLSVRALT